jgi:hypothetical protein
MKRSVLSLAVATLILAPTALAKGPSAATIDGAGAGGGISFGGGLNSGLLAFTEATGFFPAVFPRQPDPMLGESPTDDLGPKYTITWTVPGARNETWTVTQDVYPYAQPTPVTYMKSGQAIFEIPGGTRGGWFRADARAKHLLVAAGLPASPPSAGGDGSSVPRLVFPAIALLLVVSAAGVLVRRRSRPVARMAESPS